MRVKQILSRMFATLLLILVSASTVSAVDWWRYNVSIGKKKSDIKFSGGSGKKTDPYLISSEQDLAYLAYLVSELSDDVSGKYFKQTADITLNDFTVREDGKLIDWSSVCREWFPIGKYGRFSDDDFKGYYDGGGHYISGLYQARDVLNNSLKYVGLFGSCEDAVISNLTLKNVYIVCSSFNDYVGAVTGYSDNSIFRNVKVENCLIDITGSNRNAKIGGVVGYAKDTNNFTDVSFSGNIRATNSKFCGGVVGQVYGKAYFTHCSTGLGKIDIENVWYIGGLVGGFEPGKKDHGVYIDACVNNLDFHIVTLCSGVHFLSRNDFSMRRSANFGNVITNNSLLYTAMSSSNPNDCVNYGVSYLDYYLSSAYPFSDNNDYTKKGMYADRKICPKESNRINNRNGYHSDDTELSLAELKEQARDIVNEFNKACGENVWGFAPHRAVDGDHLDVEGCPLPIACGGVAEPGKFYGTGTSEDPFLISSEADLRQLQKLVSDGKFPTEFLHFKLTNDIYMSDSLMDPIGVAPSMKEKIFMGTFDGNGYAIHGLRLQGSGLFGILGGTVKNLALIDPVGRSQGMLAYRLGTNDDGEAATTGTISNCYVGGSQLETSVADNAGLCYRVSSGSKIENSYFKGTVYTPGGDNGIFSGICSKLDKDATVDNCFACFYLVSSRKADAYGVVYKQDKNSTVTNCYAYISNSSEGGANYLGGAKKLLEFPAYYYFKGCMRSPFVDGMDNPVLPTTKHYEVLWPLKEADNTIKAELTYIDAIPLEVSANYNMIVRYIPAEGEDYKSDRMLWNLPNVAVYDADSKTDYLLDYNLYPRSSFIHTSYDKSLQETNTPLMAQLHFPLSLTGTNKTYMLCLPGKVEKKVLPEGSKLMICGKVTKTDGEYQANIVECDSVPAGLPFLAYIPGKEGEVVDILMRGKVANKPIQSVTLGNVKVETDLKGNFFNGYNLVPAGTYIAVDSTEVGYEMVANDGSSTKVECPLYSACIEKMDGEEAPYKNIHLIDYILLNEVADNIGDVIESNQDKTVNLKLKRALKAGSWNTICLPFSLSEDEVKNVFGEGTRIEKLSDVNYADGVCSLKFGSESTIKAGVAYLLKPSKVSEDGVYSLGNKQIASAEPEKEGMPVTMDGESFNMGLYGTYERQLLAGDSDGFGTVLGNVFFIQGNNLYQVGSGQNVTLNGFRCYIQTSSAAATQALSGARLVHADGSTTALRLVEMGKGADGSRIYDLQGIETAKPVKAGVYVKNGKKFVVK